MNDDLNTPGALASIFELIRAGNGILDRNDNPEDRVALVRVMDELADEILGLDLTGGSSSSEDTAVLCGILAQTRGILRENRMFEATDLMRDKLEAIGYTAKDLPGGKSEIVKK